MDTYQWSAKPGFFMQPWTLMSPDSMGQFPAAALIFREGLVATGDVLVDLNLKIADIENLKGTPMPQNAALDALGLKNIPDGDDAQARQRDRSAGPLRPAGRTSVSRKPAVPPSWSIWLRSSIDPHRP